MIRSWLKRRRQGTLVYCPFCKFELVAGGEWIGSNVGDASLEGYRCANCGTTSGWLFDAPAPILIGWPLSDPSRWKRPETPPSESGSDMPEYKTEIAQALEDDTRVLLQRHVLGQLGDGYDAPAQPQVGVPGERAEIEKSTALSTTPEDREDKNS